VTTRYSHDTITAVAKASALTLTRDDHGQWALWAPDGGALLTTGPSEWNQHINDWARPNITDYCEAIAMFTRRTTGA
jgi:hypothetical protein